MEHRSPNHGSDVFGFCKRQVGQRIDESLHRFQVIETGAQIRVKQRVGGREARPGFPECLF